MIKNSRWPIQQNLDLFYPLNTQCVSQLCLKCSLDLHYNFLPHILIYVANQLIYTSNEKEIVTAMKLYNVSFADLRLSGFYAEHAR